MSRTVTFSQLMGEFFIYERDGLYGSFKPEDAGLPPPDGQPLMAVHGPYGNRLRVDGFDIDIDAALARAEKRRNSMREAARPLDIDDVRINYSTARPPVSHASFEYDARADEFSFVKDGEEVGTFTPEDAGLPPGVTWLECDRAKFVSAPDGENAEEPWIKVGNYEPFSPLRALANAKQNAGRETLTPDPVVGYLSDAERAEHAADSLKRRAEAYIGTEDQVLMSFFPALYDWHIEVEVGRIADDHAEVTVVPGARRATITLDWRYGPHDTDYGLVYSLAHELAHASVGTLLPAAQAIIDSLAEADRPAGMIAERLWGEANEQHARQVGEWVANLIISEA